MVAIEIVVPQGRKTRMWVVENKRTGFVLGSIAWYTGWRQYVFSPSSDTVFNPGCLEELAKFMREQTLAHAEQHKGTE